MGTAGRFRVAVVNDPRLPKREMAGHINICQITGLRGGGRRFTDQEIEVASQYGTQKFLIAVPGGILSEKYVKGICDQCCGQSIV